MEWEPEDRVACWTLVEADRNLIANKTGTTRRGFAVLLKDFELEGRFPRHAGDVPRQTIASIGEQLRIAPDLFGAYAWSNANLYGRFRLDMERHLDLEVAAPGLPGGPPPAVDAGMG